LDVNGAARINANLYLSSSGVYLSAPVSGQYGSIEINGGSGSGWEGYSIGGDVVFMSYMSSIAGLYNDVNNQWLIRSTFAAETAIFYEGTARVTTTSTGASITGNLLVSSLNTGTDNAVLVWNGSEVLVDEIDSRVWGRSLIGGTLSINYIPKATAGTTLANSVIYESGGNIGIGTTSPNGKLHIYENFGGDSTAIPNQLILETYRTDFSDVPGGNSILFKNQDSNNGTNEARIRVVSVNDVDYGENNESTSNFIFSTTSAGTENDILTIAGTKRVGIRTSNPSYTLEVNGTFAATSKSFVIDHPTKSGYKLRYGSLESPYHGIRLTGKGIIKNGKCVVELPEYISKLARHENVNIQLTNYKHNKKIWVEDIDVNCNKFTVECNKKHSKKEYEFFWDFTAIRNDIDELFTEYLPE
jgi:hypothetical protein